MRAVTKFEAEDGTLFDTAEEATEHDNLCDLEDWYDADHELFGPYEGCKVQWRDLVKWMTQYNQQANMIVTACRGRKT